MTLLSSLNQRLEDFLAAPEANAAGRMSLFRIVYVLFYLKMYQGERFFELAYIPPEEWTPVFPLGWLSPPSSPVFYALLEAALIFCLLLLLVGYRVRLATLGTLVFGALLESFGDSFTTLKPHSTLFLVFYIPFIMFFCNWGSNYSLDALLRRRRGEPPVDPADSSWHYIWGQRVLLALFLVIMVAAAWTKINGQWLVDPHLMSTLLTAKLVATPYLGRLLPYIAVTPPLYLAMHAGTLLFEASAPAALINRTWRNLYLSAVILFHALNLFLINVSFYYHLIFYGLFVDWQALAAAVRRRIPLTVSAPRLPTTVLAGGALALAALGALTWTLTPAFSPRAAVDLLPGDWFVWGVSGVPALVVFLLSAYKIMRPALARLSSGGKTTQTRPLSPQVTRPPQ